MTFSTNVAMQYKRYVAPRQELSLLYSSCRNTIFPSCSAARNR